MNKDVVYIEPEDDITDIILKIENSKEKIVALVPPKKAGVFRSIVNIKLIAKAGASNDKTVVLVTTDPSIVKLAAATKIPVTKNLQSAPIIPKEDEEDAVTKKDLAEKTSISEPGDDEDDEDEEEDKESEKDNKKDSSEPTDEKDDDDDDDDEDEDEDKKDDKKGKAKERQESKKNSEKSKKTGSKDASRNPIEWIKEHKKIAIIGGVCGVLLIIVLVWALVIAPAVTITVGIRTTNNNFSENVSFVSNQSEENAEEGKFHLEEKKIEQTKEVQFEATGKKNVGEKATGELVVYTFFKNKGTVQVTSGSGFSFNGLSYSSSKDVSLSWDGQTASKCENNGEASAITSGCLISARVSVVAGEPGSKYNVAASNTGWNTTAPVAVYSDKAMSGGTDDTITVVQQSDIDKAKAELSAQDESSNKEKLYESLPKDVIVIDSSFKQSANEAVSSPAVGEEVKEGVTPTLKATTTTSVSVVDKTKVEEFITKKANLGESQKIYEMKNPFIESFTQTSSGATGKLKTSYMTGPKITENDVVEKTKGKGLGEAQHNLRDIDGVAAVTIDKSFPWVMSVPGDANKITVIFEVKDQNGNSIEQKKDEENKNEDNKDDKNKDSEKKEESQDDKKE